jgi:TRAP-type C4-dicarboxylate transport system substrate-binding protein
VNVEADATFVAAVEAALVESGGNYTVEWTIGHAGSIVKLPAIFQSVADGVVDMGVTSQALEQSKIPLMNVNFVVPFTTMDHHVASRVLDETNAVVPAMAEAWDRQGVHFLTSWGFDPYVIMSKEPINSIDDFNGLKVGGIGPNLAWFNAVGAVGVVASNATAYNDMQSGVFDAMVTSTMGAASSRIYEVAPYVVQTGIGAMPVNIVVFNKARWDTLPPEVQAAISAGVEAWEAAYLARVDASVGPATAAMVTSGASVIDWSEAERARWVEALPPLGTDWVAATSETAPAAQEVLTAYVERLRANGVTMMRDWSAPAAGN